MSYVLGGIGVLVGLVVLFIAYRYVATVRGGARTMEALESRIAPVAEAIHEGQEPSLPLIEELARAADTRHLLFQTLRAMGREELFPKEFSTPEAIAESELVRWLLHPNELGGLPDEIYLAKTIERDTTPPSRYFVFRFRNHPPHWAAERGWTAGVAGPYYHSARTGGAFSRFEPFDSKIPEEHVAAVDELLSRT